LVRSNGLTYASAMRTLFSCIYLASAISLLCLSGCKRTPSEVVVFYAASLTQPLGEIAKAYESAHPGVHVRLEPSGSQIAARKVSEMGMAADVVLVADAKVIERILVPAHARFDVVFATNEIVLAHKDHSRFTDEVSTQNWPDILRRPGVTLGRADPDTAPIGYHTLIAWQLAERSGMYGDSGKALANELASRSAKQNVVHDETELLAQLESRAIDYAFLYRSTAEDHHLKLTLLRADQNLSRPDLAGQYAAAEVSVRMKQGEEKVLIKGGPITYGLTIPLKAQNAIEADRFAAFVLGQQATSVFARRGFRPVAPALCAPCEGVPPELTRLVSPGR
jgi:molybdate/tungstate transport system substrate-binding protein